MQMREPPEAKRAGCSAIQDAASNSNRRAFPVLISQAAISSVPTVSDRRLPDGLFWQATWRLDEVRRQLLLACVLADPGRRVMQRAGTGDMMDALLGSPNDRKRLEPQLHSTGDRWIWGGEVEWTLGSILAPIKPDIADPSTYRNGKCRLGPDRRYCLSFVWQREDAQCMIGGGYCWDMVEGEEPDPIDMLTALDLRLRVHYSA